MPPGPLAVPGVRSGPPGGRGSASVGRRSPRRTRRTPCSPPWTRPTGRAPRPGATTRPSARPRPWWQRRWTRWSAATTPRNPPPRRGIRHAGQPESPAHEADPDRRASQPDQDLIAAWDRDAGLLLAERSQRRGDGVIRRPTARPAVGVGAGVAGLGPGRAGPAGAPPGCRGPRPGGRARARPSTSGWSSATWAAAPDRRQRPRSIWAPLTTAAAVARATVSWPGFCARFERSEWSDRWPVAVEVPFETPGRRPAGPRQDRRDLRRLAGRAATTSFDWKTGRPARVRSRTPCRRRPARRLPPRVGGASRVFLWRRCGQPFTTSRTSRRSARPTCSTEAGLAALIEHVPAED